MANNVPKVHGIAIASIAKINGQNDSDLAKISGQEFTGITEAHTLLSSQTASGSDTDITFDVSGYSYNMLLFEFINFDSTDGADDYMSFQVRTGGSYPHTYNHPFTTAFFRAYHEEDDNPANFQYYASAPFSSDDSENSWQPISSYMSVGESDSSASGSLTLYSHRSNTFHKHFMARSSTEAGAAAYDAHANGVLFTSDESIDPINYVRFQAGGGGTFTATIKLFGLATS